jgi:hypothetical protein
MCPAGFGTWRRRHAKRENARPPRRCRTPPLRSPMGRARSAGHGGTPCFGLSFPACVRGHRHLLAARGHTTDRTCLDSGAAERKNWERQVWVQTCRSSSARRGAARRALLTSRAGYASGHFTLSPETRIPTANIGRSDQLRRPRLGQFRQESDGGQTFRLLPVRCHMLVRPNVLPHCALNLRVCH